jgi:hypothetical protein
VKASPPAPKAAPLREPRKTKTPNERAMHCKFKVRPHLRCKKKLECQTAAYRA